MKEEQQLSTFDEDWEEWSPEKGSFVHHMIAGSLAGVTEHVSIFPIDTIKTHMQCQQCDANGERVIMSASQTARKLVAEEGSMRLFRGVSTMLGASLPAHAMYFSMFEATKKLLGADSPDVTPVASGLTGVTATICHDSIMTPMDVVKQRLQLGYYSGVSNCIKRILNEEGFRALYISYPTTLLMNLPFNVIMVSANETFKKILNPSGEMNVTAYMTAGAASGAIAGVLTNPLDVAKTRLQTQMMMVGEDMATAASVRSTASFANSTLQCDTAHCPQLQAARGVSLDIPASCPANQSVSSTLEGHAPKLRTQYRGLVDALGQIYAQEGLKGFFRGAYPRLLVNAPSVAVSWTTFEVLKKVLDEMAGGH